MNKVYVVIECSGQYDDYSERIIAIHEDSNDAAIYKLVVLADIELIKKSECPVDGVSSYSDLVDKFSDENKFTKEWDMFIEWEEIVDNAKEISNLRIEEHNVFGGTPNEKQ